MTLPRELLFKALAANALFSALSGLVLLAAPARIADELGFVDPLWVGVVGGGLLLFAGQLALIVRARRVERWEMATIITGDISWVIGSVILVALFFPVLTTLGMVLIGAVALIVLDFALLQWKGYLQYR